MIDKFNFYDIYGYFIPGAALLLLLCLPHGLVLNSWPASSWASALIAVIMAYIAGQLLQMVATKVIPTSVATGDDGHPRYPSDVVLDKSDSSLTAEFKTNLAAAVKKKLTLDLDVDNSNATLKVDQARRDAFFLARHTLIRAKEVSYAEQFEGMYALTRGLACSLTVACFYYAGWAFSIFHAPCVECAVVIVVVIGVLGAVNASAQVLRRDLGPVGKNLLELLGAICILLVAAGVGYALGRGSAVTPAHAGTLALCSAMALLGSLRCYGAYRSYGNNFAITVWRDYFVATQKDPAPPETINM